MVLILANSSEKMHLMMISRGLIVFHFSVCWHKLSLFGFKFELGASCRGSVLPSDRTNIERAYQPTGKSLEAKSK